MIWWNKTRIKKCREFCQWNLQNKCQNMLHGNIFSFFFYFCDFRFLGNFSSVILCFRWGQNRGFNNSRRRCKWNQYLISLIILLILISILSLRRKFKHSKVFILWFLNTDKPFIDHAFRARVKYILLYIFFILI